MLQLSLRKQLGALQINVDITMPARGVLALFGRSGCGKTSTINLLAGLLTPDAGRVQLDQMTVFDSAHGVNLPIEARRIGYVFQQPRLFPHLSVDGNLRYGLKRARSASSQPFSHDTIVDLLGIRALLTRRPHQLSGGEQQRVAIGRALLAQPQLLLLDEPLASLDQARRNDILPYLERVRDDLGLPMIYISHQFEEVLQLATQVALMEDGKVLAQGTPAEISHHAALAAIIGDEAMGTIIDSHVTAIDADTSLAQIPVGHGRLQVNARQLQIGQAVRLQLLARDLILATEPPRGLSVRNQLAGQVTRIEMTEQQAVNVAVDVGGITLIARITRAAATDLRIESGMPIWLLIKAVSLRSHVYRTGT